MQANDIACLNFEKCKGNLNLLNAMTLDDKINQPRPKHQKNGLDDVVEGSLRKEKKNLLLAPNDNALAFTSRS